MPKAAPPLTATSLTPTRPSAAPADNASPAIDAIPESYEAANRELETLITMMESGDIPLEQLLAGYQRGATLLQFCRDKLQAVEDQIKVLEDGTLKAWKPQ